MMDWGAQELRVLIDPENRSAQEAATTASHPSPAETEKGDVAI